MTSKESTGITRWIQGLMTKEDPQYIHKTLGILALASYIWRLAHIGDDDMGFHSHPSWTLPTLLLHLVLSASSFQFRIPPRRITTDGGRIWPEYRLHSLIFSTRSVACIALHWYEQHFHVQNSVDYSTILWIVLISMGAADLSSYAVGLFHSNSVRELRAPLLARYFFSVMQFFATAAHLVDGGRPRRRSSLCFYILMVIQVSAFLLTLRRKRLVSHTFNLVVYGILLLCGFTVGVYECHQSGYTIWTNGAVLILTACTAALWRMGPWPRACRQKYIIWTVVYWGLDRVLRPVLVQDVENTTWMTQSQMIALACFELIVVIAYGIYKTAGTLSSFHGPKHV